MTRSVGAAALALAVLAGAAPVQGQVVERAGTSDIAVDRRLERLLGADPLIITSDRRIAVDDTIRRSVLVLDATLIHEGTIVGHLVAVDAGVFVRHQAAVAGDLVNIAGGLYRSALAAVGGTIIDLPEATYRVVREPDRIVIEASGTPSRLTLDGWKGIHVPTYDRVNGVGLAWGARYRLPRLGDITPTVHGHGGWRTEPGEPQYGGALDVRWGAIALEGGYEWGWDTHDDWMIRDLRNSINYAWDGDDFRDYYGSERRWVAVRQAFGDEAKSFSAVLRLGGQVEDASSLPGDEPWHLLGDSVRSNPPIDEGRISSAIARLDLEWHGRQTDLVAGVEYEAAGGWRDGAYAFDRVAAWASFAMRGLLDHTLEIRAYGQMPLGQDTLPRQRRTLLGGAGTLQTVPIGRYQGDHAAFLESIYRTPLPEALALPVIGSPELQLIHAAGMAWVGDADPALVQEIGGRLQFLALYFQYMLQPATPARDELIVGLAWPFAPGFPWERR